METILMMPVPALKTIDITDDNKDNSQYIPLLYDLLRMLMIQVVVNLLYLFSHKDYSFFNDTFIKTLLFITVGISSYWLVLRKMIAFK